MGKRGNDSSYVVPQEMGGRGGQQSTIEQGEEEMDVVADYGRSRAEKDWKCDFCGVLYDQIYPVDNNDPAIVFRSLEHDPHAMMEHIRSSTEQQDRMMLDEYDRMHTFVPTSSRQPPGAGKAGRCISAAIDLPILIKKSLTEFQEDKARVLVDSCSHCIGNLSLICAPHADKALYTPSINKKLEAAATKRALELLERRQR